MDHQQADAKPQAPPFLLRIGYRYRNLSKRFFGKLKQLRAVAARYGKGHDGFTASLHIAPVRIWLRHAEPVAYPGLRFLEREWHSNVRVV